MTADGLTSFIIKATEKPTKLLMRDYLELEQLRQVSTSNNIRNFVLHAIERTKKILIQNLELYPNSKVAFDENCIIDEKDNIIFYVIPIEGIDNFLYTLPFFSMVIVARIKNIPTAKTCVINFPLLGEIYYASSNQGAWIAKTRNNINNTSRIKISKYLSQNSPNILVDKIKTCSCKIKINDIPLHLHHIKILGSTLYSICLIVQNKAEIFIASNLNYIMKLIIELFPGEAGILCQKHDNYHVLSNNKEAKIQFITS